MTSIVAGVDIGGTKCAVSVGRAGEGTVDVMGRHAFPTPPTPDRAMGEILAAIARLLHDYAIPSVAAIGVSAGGPLDSTAGVLLSPPNLPGWDRVDVVTPLRDRFGVPVALQNDANACALAEWRWGAGQGCRNMIFLTFGTGMGAGFILDGRLYAGTNDLAGEVGHVRLERDGPVGYRKEGSFEGFCSGGGIAQLARSMADAWLRTGRISSFCRTLDDLPQVTAEMVGEAAQRGDALALEVWRVAGRQLGRGLALLVDILNPERIVIGSIYGRRRPLLEPVALEELRREALPQALAACRVVPAGLGERVGDVAGLAVASNVAGR